MFSCKSVFMQFRPLVKRSFCATYLPRAILFGHANLTPNKTFSNLVHCKLKLLLVFV